MADTTAAIISIANQPSNFSLVEMTNCPITSGRNAINIITTLIGTEMTQLMMIVPNAATTVVMYAEFQAKCGASARA